MIHEHLKELCETEVPNLEWTTAFYSENDHTGTVHMDGGDSPHQMDGDITYPSFGVLIRSTDWDLVEAAAYRVMNLLHKRRNEIMFGYLYSGGRRTTRMTYQVMSIMNRGGILELGITDNNVREVRLIFDTRLFKLKEEEL